MVAKPTSTSHAGASIAPATKPASTIGYIKVWDVAVRIFHWSLVTIFAAAFITADEWDRLHQWLGYIAVALITWRILWGFVGSKHARFRDFVRGPFTVMRYLIDMLRGREPRYIGHNPAGGTMIICLLLGIIGLGLTGWMMTLDQFFGVGWVEDAHELIANGMLVLIALHIAGVIYASIKHKENLVRAMITGRKRTSR